MNTLLGFPEGGMPAYGRLLREWRTRARMSQLSLATEAGISSRHLSFLETGRAQPSREMVQLLAGMLDVPLAERNALLVAAGYAPAYDERPLGALAIEPVRRPLEFILRQQEPFPAFVLDGEWNIVMKNAAAARIFPLFRGSTTSSNCMRSVFAPDGLRPSIVNWSSIAECLIQALHRDVAATGSEAVVQLRDEVLAYPEVPRRWRTPDAASPFQPFVNMELRKDDLSMAFFGTLTTFAAPRDVTIQHLRIECFFPADAVTEQTARRLAVPEPIAV
jgi:transcriptional regulator with XRE-family HTH domain